MVAQMPDLVVTDSKKWPVMAVEVQNPLSFDRDYAIDFRKSILPSLALAEKVPYFMLVSQDRGYLWKNNDELELDAPPSVEFDMKPVVKHFLARFKRSNKRRLSSDSLEFYVSLWIDGNINPREGVKAPFAPPAISKVFAQFKGGEVKDEAPIF